MDDWFYYDVVHGLHTYCNPISEPSVRELEHVLALRPGQRVLDVACGHAAMLVGFAERFGIRGVGVDLSPFALGRAEALRAERVPAEEVELRLEGGAEHVPAGPYDVAMCVGASWIWQGWRGTLKALVAMTRPGGRVVVGEPYWMEDPPEPYLRAEGLQRDQFPILEEIPAFAAEQKLTLVWMHRSTSAEWDTYEMLQTASLDRFLERHPEHPEADAIARRLASSKDAYLRWGKDCCGFSVWVFRLPRTGV